MAQRAAAMADRERRTAAVIQRKLNALARQALGTALTPQLAPNAAKADMAAPARKVGFRLRGVGGNRCIVVVGGFRLKEYIVIDRAVPRGWDF